MLQIICQHDFIQSGKRAWVRGGGGGGGEGEGAGLYWWVGVGGGSRG